MKNIVSHLLWIIFAGLALQGFFALRIATLAFFDPQTSSFMRSEIWRIGKTRLTTPESSWHWSHQWVPGSQISRHLKQAAIASEDANFLQHNGVDWAAIQTAWIKNQQQTTTAPRNPASVRIIGGSTITQQLVKNLLLSGERHWSRKAQELVLSLLLETCLDKSRILDIYLNSVEWGDGIFGAEAAAQHYFNRPAAQLSAKQATWLIVMLPAPKRYALKKNAAYLKRRSAVILARMKTVRLPDVSAQ